MRYRATVRLQKGTSVDMPPFEAKDIILASGVVRAEYGLDTDNPHRGFTITECVRWA